MYKFSKFSNTNSKKIQEGDCCMKKRILWIALAGILLGIAIGIGYYLYQMNQVPKLPSLEEEKTLASNGVTDECTEFSEAYAKGLVDLEVLDASYEEKIITPNTTIKTREIYTKCGHTVENVIEVSENLVNKTKEEFSNEYIGWDVDVFNKEEVILSRKLDKMCPEHYILKEENEEIVIYRLEENGNLQYVRNTEITTKYLPETDKLALKNGIKATGKEQLNRVIEDYE